MIANPATRIATATTKIAAGAVRHSGSAFLAQPHRWFTPIASASRRELIVRPRAWACALSMKKRTRPPTIAKWITPRAELLRASVTVRIGWRPSAASVSPVCGPSMKASAQSPDPAAEGRCLTTKGRPSTDWLDAA